MAEEPVALLPLHEFISHVQSQPHAMAGAVIAATAAQAVALGNACIHISRQQFNYEDDIFAAHLEQMNNIQLELVHWCNEDANAIATYASLRDAGKPLMGKQLLCHAPATVGVLAVQAAELLQEFRLHVHERVRDDLEMSISLLSSSARAALLLLDSNLRIWTDPALQKEFNPRQGQLVLAIQALSPQSRIFS